MDEAEKEYKKMTERISESQEAMKVILQSSSYVQNQSDFLLTSSVVTFL